MRRSLPSYWRASPSPAPTPSRPKVRLLTIQAFGCEQVCYNGMCGARTAYTAEYLVAEVMRVWETDKVAEQITRTYCYFS